MEDLRRSYDKLPYPDLPKPYAHISRTAAVARLHGLQPPSPAACRVLELGCADGGNLLPMACQFPHSQFMGVDFSPVQIAIGRKRVEELSLPNLSLTEANILNLRERDFARFDYIIVHGVYSWVPAAVQKEIMAICRDFLSEDGLAYISYNTQPGWRGKQALREILRFHTRHIEDIKEKAEAAIALVAAMPDTRESPGDPGAIWVQRLQNELRHMDDPRAYLVHEYLIDGNKPLYFREFLQRAESHELRYVDDAFPGSTSLERLSPKGRAWLATNIVDYADQQQYIDFFCNVAFRRSLLCRCEKQPDRTVCFDRLEPLYATATCRRSESKEEQGCFVTHAGRRFHTDHEGLNRILACLIDASPASVSIHQLRTLLGQNVTDPEAGQVFDDLLRGAALEVTVNPRECIRDPGPRPYASRLVRYQSAGGMVTSAAHRPVRLENPFERYLLGLLDGTRTVAEIIPKMRKKLRPSSPIEDDRWNQLVEEHLIRLS
ncbi:MAG: class I SAM-dependent methyltransferase, partial [Desulfobacterales bacterium]